MRSPARIPPSRAAVAAGLALAYLLLVLLAPTGALMLAPAAVLAAFLLRGIMPGERLITRLRARRDRPARRPSRNAPRPVLPFVPSPAGRLCVSALAMRPPPRRVLLNTA